MLSYSLNVVITKCNVWCWESRGAKAEVGFLVVLYGFSRVFRKKGKVAVNGEKQRSKAEELKGVRKKVSATLR